MSIADSTDEIRQNQYAKTTLKTASIELILSRCRNSGKRCCNTASFCYIPRSVCPA